MVLTVCMANRALLLVMKFAGFRILSDFAKWLGIVIVNKSLNKDEHYCKNETLDLSEINCRMSLRNKLSFMVDYLEIIVDRNWHPTTNKLMIYLVWILNLIPWELLPFITLPIDYLLNHGKYNKQWFGWLFE